MCLVREEQFLGSTWAIDYAQTPCKREFVLNILDRELPREGMEMCPVTQQVCIGCLLCTKHCSQVFTTMNKTVKNSYFHGAYLLMEGERNF